MPLKRVLDTIDEAEPDHRCLYVESDGKFILAPGLEALADQYAAIEVAHTNEMAKRDQQIAEAKATLTRSKSNDEMREAMTAAGVPVRWHKAVAAVVLREWAHDDTPLETVVRRFLDSDEGAPFRPQQETTPHFSARLFELRR